MIKIAPFSNLQELCLCQNGIYMFYHKTNILCHIKQLQAIQIRKLTEFYTYLDKAR